jgi:hypothetical protein
MRGLTLTQPWATLVAIGAKSIETRSWRSDYRGSIAIHAAHGLGPVGGRQALFDLVTSQPFADVLLAAGVHREEQLARGAIVAVAELAYCVPTVSVLNGSHPGFGKPDSRWPLTDQERAFGDYSPGRFAWLLADVRRLATPIPYRGALSLWQVPAELERRIAKEL